MAGVYLMTHKESFQVEGDMKELKYYKTNYVMYLTGQVICV